MKKPSLKISGVKTWYQTRKQKRKENEELERHLESPALKMVTFLFTAIAMGVGMSILPLFPQPLPIFLAILVAFITFKIPRVGMPIGGVIIGLGLMYHLAQLYFISFLGDMQVRVAFIVIWMILFVVPPALFNRYKSALATDFGILAVTALFIGPLYFLAIPILLASAVFFKKYVSLSIIYFVLLSVPLQIMQYFQYTVLPIVRSDWWIEPGSAPPLLVPLTSIGKDLASSMSQFRSIRFVKSNLRHRWSNHMDSRLDRPHNRRCRHPVSRLNSRHTHVCNRRCGTCLNSYVLHPNAS